MVIHEHRIIEKLIDDFILITVLFVSMLIPEHWMIERLIDNWSFQFHFDDYFILLFTVFPYWFIKIRLTSPWHNKLPLKHYSGVKMCILV